MVKVLPGNEAGYRFFSIDKYKALMPQIKDAGLKPMNLADVMKKQLEAINKNDRKEIYFWLYKFFSTADGVIYPAEQFDLIKVVLDVAMLKNINERTRLSSGAVILPPQEYDRLDGKEFWNPRFSEKLTRQEAKNDPIWQYVSRDKPFLDEYVDAIFKEMERTPPHNSKGMDIYLSSPQKVPTLRPLSIGSINRRFALDGCDSLETDAQLIGF